jgi:hypothetical protein
MLYGVRVFGEGGWETGHRWDSKRVLLDPYTPLIAGRRQFGVREERELYKKGVSISVQRDSSVSNFMHTCSLVHSC